MSEVALLECSRTKDKHPYVHRAITLPRSCLGDATSEYIADTTFDIGGTRIATITNHGRWTICDFSVRKETVLGVASGSRVLSVLPVGEKRTGWWKMEWLDDPNIVIVAESKGLYLLDIDVIPYPE